MLQNESDDIEVTQKDDEQVDDEAQGTSDQGSQNQAGDNEWQQRALKAEAILARQAKKEKAPVAQETNQPINNAPSVDPDELKLIARGLSDEEIEKAKVIAKGNGTTLLEATKDDLFLIFQKDLKDKERKEKAKLGASKGSGTQESNSVKPGMSKEDHKEIWNKAMGR